MSRLDALAAALATARPVAITDRARRWAAVAAILVPDPDAILLIRRAERSGDPWSGHMALPGGRRTPADHDLIDTAVRETAEEVGFELERGQLIGQLDDVVPRTRVLPPVAVRPFVFRLDHRPAFRLNDEVAAAAWVPLSTLLSPEGHGRVTVQLHDGARVVPAYRFEQSVVWGMTERILNLLFAQLR
jgi:8-oxo-dGTP pyrophosphatase MutT (NUDIX family)